MSTYPDAEDRFDPDLESLPDDRAVEACFVYEFPVRYMSFFCSEEAGKAITDFEYEMLRQYDKPDSPDSYYVETQGSNYAAVEFARYSMTIRRLTRMVDERFAEQYLDRVYAIMLQHPAEPKELARCQKFQQTKGR